MRISRGWAHDYYRPTMMNFVMGADGHLWGFQGTRDATRGNAVCHYIPKEAKWEHYGFPWETARGDDHWPIGVTDDAVWFAGGDLLLLNKDSGRWSVLKDGWPRGFSGSAAFTARGVLVPVGNVVKRLDPRTSAWGTLTTLEAAERITAVAESRGMLYLGTQTGLFVLSNIGDDGSTQA